MENKHWYTKFLSTKFILALLSMGVLTAVAIKAPASLTTELIVGILGVVSTYSGSNAVLSALALKKPAAVEAVAQEIVPNVPDQATLTLAQELTNLEQRVSQNEKTTAEIIEILKQLMQKKV